MKVVELKEYRKAKRIQGVSEEKEDAWPVRYRQINYLVEELRVRLSERMRLQKFEE